MMSMVQFVTVSPLRTDLMTESKCVDTIFWQLLRICDTWIIGCCVCIILSMLLGIQKNRVKKDFNIHQTLFILCMNEYIQSAKIQNYIFTHMYYFENGSSKFFMSFFKPYFLKTSSATYKKYKTYLIKIEFISYVHCT